MPTPPSTSSSSSAPPSTSVSTWLRRNLPVMVLLVGQVTTVYVLVLSHSHTLLRGGGGGHNHHNRHEYGYDESSHHNFEFGPPILVGARNQDGSASSLRNLLGAAQGGGGGGNDADAVVLAHNPLAIPPGQPPNLPRIEEVVVEGPDDTPSHGSSGHDARGFYGGKGDGKHLGGFTDFDPQGVAPGVWSRMMTQLGVKSVMDVGCGRGISTRWFYEHNATVLCVEGSHDAVSQSFVPPHLIVEHDYSRGPWWPADTYDAVWSVEFLEHVSRQYMHNYIQTLRKAAVLFVTTSRRGGWHHVEVHNDRWWIRKFRSYGFVYDEELTELVREWSRNEYGAKSHPLPNGEFPHPQHVTKSMKVFLNPAVASLPAHAHLFPEDGCLGNVIPVAHRKEGELKYESRRCGTGETGSAETPLPDSFLAPAIDDTMHQKWVDAIRAGITIPKKFKQDLAVDASES